MEIITVDDVMNCDVIVDATCLEVTFYRSQDKESYLLNFVVHFLLVPKKGKQKSLILTFIY